MTAFGPQLIGETEKTLNGILMRVLAGSELSEPQWVVLRLAGQNAAAADLAGLVAERARFPDAASLVAALGARGLVADDRLTAQGVRLVADLQARIAEITAPVWADLPEAEVAATERTLNAVIRRGREVLAG